jgi:hypothetical protein
MNGIALFILSCINFFISLIVSFSTFLFTSKKSFEKIYTAEKYLPIKFTLPKDISQRATINNDILVCIFFVN